MVSSTPDTLWHLKTHRNALLSAFVRRHNELTVIVQSGLFKCSQLPHPCYQLPHLTNISNNKPRIFYTGAVGMPVSSAVIGKVASLTYSSLRTAQAFGNVPVIACLAAQTLYLT